jgi:hypothetical protein
MVMTAERRTARLAGRTLSVRSSGPAAAIAAVSSAALVGAAVFGFGGTGLGGSGSAITGDVPGVPGSVQAIAAPSPTSNPFVRRPVSNPSSGVVAIGSGSVGNPPAGGLAGRPVTAPTTAPGSSQTSAPRPPVAHPTGRHGRPTTKPTKPTTKPPKPPTSKPPTPTPSKTPPTSIVVAFSKQQVEKASDAVRTRVSYSLAVLAGPSPRDQAAVKKVSRQLDTTLDGAVTSAMNHAANTALGDAVKASEANASEGEIRFVAAVSFQRALPTALQESVTPVVTAAVAQVVPGKVDAPAVALVADSAAASASPDVAQQSTTTVVDAVTESVTDTGDTSGTRLVSPSPTSTAAPSPSSLLAASVSPSPSPSPSPTSSEGGSNQSSGDTSAAAASSSTQSSGRRARGPEGPSRGDGDKVRPEGRTDAERRRTTQTSVKKRPARPGSTASTSGHRRGGAHVASRDDEPRRAPGRHRA